MNEFEQRLQISANAALFYEFPTTDHYSQLCAACLRYYNNFNKTKKPRDDIIKISIEKNLFTVISIFKEFPTLKNYNNICKIAMKYQKNHGKRK